jgi:catechol 2,3-dioxygenase
VLLRGINHVVLKVRSLAASDQFYRGVLGMKRVGERGPMWFYTAGMHHHDFAIVELGAGAKSPGPEQIGLFHLCFDVQDGPGLRDLHDRMTRAGIRVSGGVDHGIMRSFYTHDPDGNVVEFGYDMAREEWEHSDPFAEDRTFEIR